MRKVFTALTIMAFGALASFPVMAAGSPFMIDCSLEFDDDLDGWKIDGTNLSRNTADWFGNGSHTPDYVIGGSNATSADVIYSPVKNLVAGEPCTIEFYYNFPGGTPANLFNYGATVYACSSQSMADKVNTVGTISKGATTGWIKYSATFTPEEDGEYCFAIEPSPYTDAMASRCGWIGFDSFVIEGTEGGGSSSEPKGTPFSKLFSFDDDADFPGISVLPKGWTSNGQKPFRRYSAEALGLPTPPSGEKVVGNIGATTKLDNNLFTEMFALEAGQPATISFSYSAKTTSLDEDGDGYGFKVFASPNQDYGGAVLIGVIPVDKERSNEWMKSEEFTFVPNVDGKYCFIISPWNETGYTPGGAVAFDDISISGYEVQIIPPVIEPEVPKGEAEAFTIDCPLEFDDDLDGWKIDSTNLSRNTADWFGNGSNTPDYVIGGSNATSADVIYSPVKNLVGGEPCTIEFYYNFPGGTPANLFNYGATVYACSSQSMADKVITVGTILNNATTGWIKYAATFTPEEDGEYCFAIEPKPYTDAMASRCGWIGFDSFIIEGTAYGEGGGTGPKEDIELEPNPDHLADCIDVPYLEDFNGGNYDGTSYLPKGWTSTGSVTWVTSSHKSIPAVEGDYYMVAPHNTEGERDDRSYTPFMNLEAGKTYTIEYHVYMQGNRWNDDDELFLPTLALTVGTEQEADFHNTISTFSQECSTWVPQSYTFTPEVSGPYCFAFMLSGPTNSGYVFVDALKITADGLIARVEPAFMVKGTYTLMDNEITIAFRDEPIKMVNTSKYAESYKWTVDGAEPSTSTDANPSFVFPSDGEYTVLLEATNSKGTRKTQRKLNIQILDENNHNQQLLTLYNANQDKLFGTGETPAFDTEPDADFVTGYNRYYFDLAQRFDFAEETPLYLQQLTVTVTNRRFRAMTSFFDDQRIRPMSIVVYGAKEDGSLDESKVISRIDSTIGDLLGSSGLYSFENKDIAFDDPIMVKGTFYIAMHFDRGMEVIPQDNQLGRSFIATQVIRHGHGETTLYAKPFDKPVASDATLNEWNSVDKLDSRLKGLGGYWLLWAKTKDPISGVSAIAADGSIAFAAGFFGGNLNVSGTVEGETLAVYSRDGMLVASTVASEGVTLIPAGQLPSGMYIVKSGEKVTKVVK